LAKPSAAPLTPSAAVTLETKAARADTKIKDLMIENYLKRANSKIDLLKTRKGSQKE
jgi:hypothetical protein